MITKKVAVFSGGGAKIPITASILAELENKGFNIRDFDLFVGASAGAILSSVIGLTNLSMSEILIKVPHLLKNTFKKVWYPRTPIYERKDFLKVWGELVGLDKKFGDCKIPTIITSVDAVADKMVLFKSWEDKNKNEPAVMPVMKSFAAPIYFGQIADPINKRVYMDGGVGSYNLGIDIVWEQCILNSWVCDPNIALEIYAFGTGFSKNNHTYENIVNNRVVNQTLEFFSLGQGGMARVMSRADQVSKMSNRSEKLENVRFKYYDIEFPDSKLDAMDRIDDKSIATYIELGKKASEKPLVDI